MEDNSAAPMDVERAPRRRSAKAARAAVAEQLDSDSDNSAVSGTKEGSATRKVRSRAPVRERAATVNEDVLKAPKSKKTRSLSASQPLRIEQNPSAHASISDVETSMAPPPRPRPRARPVVKKAIHEDLPPLVLPSQVVEEDGELSDLTPISSSDWARSSPVEILACVQIPLRIASPSTSTLPRTKPRPPKKGKEPAWSITTLQTYVWVLIEPKSWRVYNQEEEEEDAIEALWWPGKVINLVKVGSPVTVKLFGLEGKTVLIKTLSEGNILSKERGHLPRFRTPTYVSSYPDSSSAPKKRQKLDRDELEAKWTTAVEEMHADDKAKRNQDDTDSDDFPEPINLKYLPAPSSKSISTPPKIDLSTKKGTKKIKGKRKRRGSDVSIDENSWQYTREEVWDEVDDELDLPGEMVLGRDGPSKDIDYWPAKLISYIPPTKSNQVGKYTLTWLDGTTGQIPRSWFYTMSEEEFVTCKVGEFESAIVEVQNDLDDDLQSVYDSTARSPSPIPQDTFPSAPDFTRLSIREQFCYTKPVLKAILDEAYAPAKHKHDRFIKGGKYRQSVVDDASLRGRMDPHDVEMLQGYIRQWCIRDDDRAGMVASANGHVSGEQSLIEIGVEIQPATDSEKRREIQVELSPVDDEMNEGGRRFSSPALTEGFRSSPQMPPSSLPLPKEEFEREDSLISISVAADEDLPPLSATVTTVTTEHPPLENDDDTIDLTIIVEDDVVQPPLPLNRQIGAADYESLTRLEKVDYCINILLPEAVRQILLWRSGARTSMNLLSSQEEEDLYRKGETLLQERDWVNDIMRYRRTMEKLHAKRQSAVAATAQRKHGHNRTGSAPRLRRNIAMPNYQE